MRISALLYRLINVVVLCVCPLMQVDGAEPQEQALTAFLRHYLDLHDQAFNGSTRYSVAFGRLSDEAQDAFVYVSGRGWCGSGGCTALILEKKQASYRVLDKIPLARLPITVLPSKSKGWHDLAMWVRGGGVTPGYVAVFKFDGREYRLAPTASHAQSPLNGGFVLPLDEDGRALYP